MRCLQLLIGKMNQFPINDLLILNASDDTGRTTALTANLKRHE